VCERVPIALEVLGCVLRNGTSERRAERRLSDGGAVHKLMSQEGKAVFDMSYQGLTPPAARLYRLLALHPGADFDGELAEAIDPDGDDLLNELEKAGMLRAAHGDRYSFNSLARGHALQRLDRDDSAEEQLAALRRIVWWHVDRAIAADKVISEHRWRLSGRYADVDRFDGTDQEAMDWLEPDRANFVQVVSAAYESEMDDAVIALAEALWGLHFQRKLYADWQVVNEVGIKAAIRRGDRRAQARMRCQLGFRHYELDDFAAAKREFSAAVDVEPADHHQGMATDLESLALAHYGLGEFEAALDCVDRAAPFAAQPQQVALLGHHRARFLSALGQHDEALVGLVMALEFFRGNGNRYNEARVLTSVGEAYLRAGEADKALPALERALTIMDELHRLFQQALIRGVLSQAHQALGDLDAARGEASGAHAILHVLEHPREVAARQRLDELS
jgi:tetratricopeptide (TPR) repeat protein